MSSIGLWMFQIIFINLKGKSDYDPIKPIRFEGTRNKETQYSSNLSHNQCSNAEKNGNMQQK